MAVELEQRCVGWVNHCQCKNCKHKSEVESGLQFAINALADRLRYDDGAS